MRKLVLALLLVVGLSFAKDHVFFSVGINLGTPYHCPERVVYVERPVVYRSYLHSRLLCPSGGEDHHNSQTQAQTLEALERVGVI